MQEENEQLRRQIAEMEADIRQGQLDSAENERLRSLLDLQEERPDLTEDIVLANRLLYMTAAAAILIFGCLKAVLLLWLA